MRTRAMRWGVALMLAGLVLAGCSEGSEPEPAATGDRRPLPTAHETVDPTPSATELTAGPPEWPEPERPAAMERDDIEGAKAAAEYFLALYGYIFATGDIDAWESYSHAECLFCRGASERVRELYDEGGYALGGEFEVHEVIAEGPDPHSEEFRVGLIGVEAPSYEYSASNELVRELGGGEAQYNLALAHDGHGWLLRGGSIEAGEA